MSEPLAHVPLACHGGPRALTRGQFSRRRYVDRYIHNGMLTVTSQRHVDRYIHNGMLTVTSQPYVDRYIHNDM